MFLWEVKLLKTRNWLCLAEETEPINDGIGAWNPRKGVETIIMIVYSRKLTNLQLQSYKLNCKTQTKFYTILLSIFVPFQECGDSLQMKEQ